MALWAWISFIGTVLTALWAAKSLVAYHTWTFEQQVADAANSPLPLNEAGVKFFSALLKPYNDPSQKQSMIRTHTIITLFISVSLMIQLMKTVRANAIWLHRWLGRATILVALAATPGFAVMVAGLFNTQAMYAEYPIVFMIPYFGIKGWREVRNKQIMDHRASMIMFSACFYYFFVQRLIMMLFNAIHHQSTPWARYTGLGPWQQWTEAEYNAWFGISISCAFSITFGFAVYNAYIGPNSVAGKLAADAAAKEKKA